MLWHARYNENHTPVLIYWKRYGRFEFFILKEREKRRRRVLIEQLKAHEAQEVFEKIFK